MEENNEHHPQTTWILMVRLFVDNANRSLVVSSLQGIVEMTRAQPDCRHFNICQSLNRPDRLFLVQEWETREALNRHIRSQEFRVVLTAMDLSSSPPEVRISSILSSEGLEYLEMVLADA